MMYFSEIAKKIEENKKNIEFMQTGFHLIDSFLDGGFLRKELVVLGGPTGKGKSSIAGHIFHSIAKQGFKSAYFSLELSNEMIASRLMGSLSNIKPTRIMTAFLSEEEAKAESEAKTTIEVHDTFMYFYDDIYILAQIQKEVMENGFDFVVIDFIQNVMAGKEQEYERLSLVSLELQKLAKKANCCILALSQLSNSVAKDKDGGIVEYRGSGSIAHVCDLGFFIEQAESMGTLENAFTLRLRKNRRGIAGVHWDFVFKQPGGQIFSL